MDQVKKLEAVCKAHDVKLPQAALRFPLTHPSVVTVIPGAVSPKEVAMNVKTMSTRLPKALWKQMKSTGLVDPRAPTP
jgi:D-threo-aldose 1-dehydrogenase